MPPQESVRRVLLVEDDQDIAEITRYCLEPHFAVSAAQDGEEALKHLRALSNHELPHAIIFDISMPRMSGYEFRAELGNDERLRKIPLLTLTAFSRSKELDRRLNVNAVLEKPVELPVLLQTVQRLCNGAV